MPIELDPTADVDLSLEQSLREALTGEANRAIELRDDLLFVRAPQPDLEAVGRRLEQFDGQAMRQVSAELRHGRVAPAALTALLQAGPDVGEHAGRLDGLLRTASLLQGWFDVRVGRELSYVRDEEVEIAQESAIANPVVGVLFVGATMTGQVLPVAAGQYRFDLEFSFSELVGDMATFDPKHPRLSSLNLPRVRCVHFRQTPVLENNKWTLLHVAPLPGTDQHYVVMARVRE